MPSVNLVGLKEPRIAKGRARRIPAIGQRNTCRESFTSPTAFKGQQHLEMPIQTRRRINQTKKPLCRRGSSRCVLALWQISPRCVPRRGAHCTPGSSGNGSIRRLSHRAHLKAQPRGSFSTATEATGKTGPLKTTPNPH